MLAALLTVSAISLAGTPSTCELLGGPVRGAAGVDYEALYRSGRTYTAFRDAAQSRTDAWRDHYAHAEVPDALRRRAAAVAGTWRLLVVAEDWCGDSANTIPYLARLVDVAGNLEMRIISSDSGREVMETHRTPDGRAATPTVILLDERYVEAGCFVERPARLQTWFLEHERQLSEDELYKQKYAWYADDRGQSTIGEVVELLEAAAAGTPRCTAGRGQ